MLSGKISYYRGNKRFIYDVDATDTSENFSMYMTSGNYDAIMLMSNSEFKEDPDALWERSVSIKLAKVDVQTKTKVAEVDGKQKNVKCPVNADFFCRLASIIRYCKVNCNTFTEKGYTGLQLASGEFEAMSEKSYILKFPMDESCVLAEVTLNYGDLVDISAHTDDFDIELHSNTGKEERVFYKPKNAWSSGIRLDSEYLGFQLKEQVIPTTVSSDGMYHSIEDIIAAHPDKEFKWLLGKDYRIVTDETLEEICNYIMNWDGYVYYDTETTGLKINFMSRTGQADQLVGVVLSVKYGESFYFPLQMKKIKNLCGGDHFYVMEHYLRPILEGKKLVAHNMSYDWKVAYIYGINANIVHDTMAILHLTLGAEIKDYKVGLKENAKLLLGRDSLELSDLIIDDSWGENDIKFWDLPEDLVRLYACADTDNTNGLLGYAIQNDLLGKYGANKVYEIEIAFSFAVAYQEFYGHRIDINNLDKMREEIGKGQAKEMEEMVKIIGHEFNPSSPKQLLTIMYGELGIPEQISRKTGRPTTDKETLKMLAELTDAEDNIMYPFVVHLQKYREYEGVRKIIDKFPEHVTQDGYVFSSVMQYGTTTGRVSINKPNYQSYNDPIKKNVIPRPGFWMFDTDYSSVEYRVLGNMVGNKKIMENFKDPDFDYHAYQAAHMYNVPYSAVTKKLRKAAKGINFGLPYGMGDESLGVRVFGEASPENTRKAAGLRAAYFKGQEDIRDWFEFHRDKGVNKGYTETYFGRRRYYRRSDFSVNAIRRQAGNQVIQGCIQGDTLIHERVAGTVKIKDLAGYKAEVWNGTTWTNGDVLYSGKKRKCIVKFRGGYEMICSPQHKFLVRSHRGSDRFVECKDLIPLYDGDRVRKNAHRVVVCQDFIESDHKYVSERIYNSNPSNSNNVYLDDIKDSFTRGVVLGRLSSDGSLDMNKGMAKQIIAEHELDVYDYLVEAMTPLNCHYQINEVRQDRNEALAYVTVYSSSLAKEIESLDIRHTIDPRIWADTEMLRGFLRGLFDGDGGVAGKTITFIQGTQENFEPFMKEIQKALLFFGIRSRYRSYDDRYVLQIKTTDNDRFVEAIGFINERKQLLASQLECVEDEHVFGRCLMVESVEITDELIDMYDVCNTSCGYYVADGVVTHNTAADIYKTAVGRVFKRICREGWLGQVMFTGFIHDELLGEVSNDINPGVWLKALREEFEVKITNEDGSPWSPLYMGFGYGMSWYEAKSVELPIKLQWEIVDKYGETGFPDWDGNGRAFCDKVPDMLRDFDVRDIRNQVLDEASQGKEIKPTLNNQVLDCVKEDAKVYTDAIADYIQMSGDYVMIESDNMDMPTYLNLVHDALCEHLDKTVHIQDLYRDADGNYTDKFEASKQTQVALDEYCMLHGVDRSKVNLLDIEEYNGDHNVSEASYIIGEDEVEDSEAKLQRIKDTRIDTLGLYMDTNKMEITLMALPQNYMQFIQGKVNRDGKGYNVWFKDTLGYLNSEMKGALYQTKSYLQSEDVQIIQQLYLQFFKNRK